MIFLRKNPYKLLVHKLFLLGAMVVMPIMAFAQTDEGKLENPLGPDGADSIQEFIKVLLEGVLKIGIPIVALAIIYSGFLFVAARGNTEKLTKAKNALLYSIIGAAILLGSWAIAGLISNTVLAL